MQDKVVIVTHPDIYESKGPSYAFISVDGEVITHFVRDYKHNGEEFTIYIIDHKNLDNKTIRDYVHDIYPKVDRLIVDYARCPIRQVNLTSTYHDKELQVYNYQNIEDKDEYINKTKDFILRNVNGWKGQDKS